MSKFGSNLRLLTHQVIVIFIYNSIKIKLNSAVKKLKFSCFYRRIVLVFKHNIFNVLEHEIIIPKI